MSLRILHKVVTTIIIYSLFRLIVHHNLLALSLLLGLPELGQILHHFLLSLLRWCTT
jgi:hypothetical protein